MKKKVLMILLMFLPFNVYALEGSMAVSCDKTTVSPGGTINCVLKGTVSGDTISGVSATIATSNSEALTLGDVTTNKSLWEGDGQGGDVDLYTITNKSGTFEIATFTLTASNKVTSGADVNITINDNIFSDSNFNEVGIANISQKIRIASSENGLSKLTLSTGTLSPAFDKNTLNYTTTVNQEKVTITASTIDSNSKVSGNIGEVNLNYGENKFKINVTSESNSTKTYIITITRPDNRDKDNTISSLKLNNQDIVLEPDKSDYSLDVENNINELIIEAVVSSDKASFVDDYAPRTVKLSEGKNTIEIKVMAENETIKTYTIIVNRKAKTIVGNKTNGSSNATDNSNQELVNPKTGSSNIFIITAITVILIIVILVSYRIHKKKEGDNNDKK